MAVGKRVYCVGFPLDNAKGTSMKPYVIALVLIIIFSVSPLLVALIAEGLAYISGCRASWDRGAICPPPAEVADWPI